MDNLRARGLSHRNKADLDSKRASASMRDHEEVLFTETPSDEILRRSQHLPPSRWSAASIGPQDFKREPVPPKKVIPKGLSPSSKRSHKSHKINFSDMSVGDYVYREENTQDRWFRSTTIMEKQCSLTAHRRSL